MHEKEILGEVMVEDSRAQDRDFAYSDFLMYIHKMINEKAA
jgi:hypothetical protein